jgi:hypothetical protein
LATKQRQVEVIKLVRVARGRGRSPGFTWSSPRSDRGVLVGPCLPRVINADHHKGGQATCPDQLRSRLCYLQKMEARHSTSGHLFSV